MQGGSYTKSGVGKGDLENANSFNAKGEKALEVTVTKKPSENIYLRAFIGYKYNGKKWEQIKQSDFLNNNAYFYSEEQFKKLVSEPFNKLSAYSSLNMCKMSIKVLGASKDYGYSPYYSQIYSENAYLDTCAMGEGKSSHEYFYFDSYEVRLNHEPVQPVIYGWNKYEDFVTFKYKGRPSKLYKLKEKCKTINNNSVTNVAAEINNWFKDLAYTYNPGTTSEGQDFVEDFLFNRKTGFCVHFASSAALIYRMCGYPSRYVEGYVISPDKFIKQDDGTYKAVVMDSQAHAWCETFNEILGWQVREHTVGYNGAGDGGNEETTTRKPDVAANETTAAAGTDNKQNTTHRGSTKSSDSGGSGGVVDAGAINKVIRTIGFVVLAIFIGFAVLVLPQRVRRMKKIRKIKGKNSICSTYGEVCRICNFMGADCQNLYAAEALEKMIKMFPYLSEEEWKWMYNEAVKMAFSKERASSEDNRRVYLMYRKFRKDMLAQMKGIRKFIFLFIKAM